MNREIYPWCIGLFVGAAVLALGCVSAENKGRIRAKNSKFGTDSVRLERRGRWLWYGGHPLYMVGIDMQSLVGAASWKQRADGYSGDYVRILDELRRARINKVRLWANCWFIAPDHLIQPFARRVDGRYDLTAWNDAYWARLRDFVQKAKERGILVEYCLFSQYATPEMTDGSRTGNYWTATNNRHDAFRNTDQIPGLFLEFYTNKGGMIDGRFISYYQDRLTAKAVDEVGGFGNVFFLVLNEPYTRNPAAFPWARARAAAIKKSGGSNFLVAVETEAGSRGVQNELHYYWDDPNIDIIGGHAYDPDPARLGSKLHAAQQKGKVLADNEGNDLRSKPALAAREAWGWAMAGGYYSFFTRDRDFNKVGDATWRKVIRIATTLRAIFESVRFWEMSPVDKKGRELDTLVRRAPGAGGWQVIGKVGSPYIVYTWGRPTRHGLRITLIPGDYEYRWIDVRNGDVLGHGKVDGAQSAMISAPSPQQWDGRYGLAAVIITETP